MAQVINPMATALSVIGSMAVLGITDNLMPFISKAGSLWQFHMLWGAIIESPLLVFASFWAWVMWSQDIDWVAYLGMALIAVAGTVISLRAPKQEAS